MSSSIDQRIVEMQFDNKEFESGIQTSLKSIRNLENGLQLKDGAKGFENIGRAANNVSFDTLGSGVVAIQQKFTAMEVVAITALQNIVNKAMAAGEHLVPLTKFLPALKSLALRRLLLQLLRLKGTPSRMSIENLIVLIHLPMRLATISPIWSQIMLNSQPPVKI